MASEWWTNPTTDIAIPTAIPLAWLKTWETPWTSHGTYHNLTPIFSIHGGFWQRGGEWLCVTSSQ